MQLNLFIQEFQKNNFKNLIMKTTITKTSKIKTLFILIILMIVPFILESISAQDASKIKGITTQECLLLKNYKFKDLEKDTYLKLDNGFVLDRFEMKPPYVFNFSDGMERKIFLFKISDSKDKKDLGLLAVYKNSKTTKSYNLYIPNALSDKVVWGMYIDELKDADKLEYGFSSTVAFVLGKELSSLMGAGGAGALSSKSDEYEFCFPENAMVMLNNKTEVPISKINKKDILISYKGEQPKLKFTKVNKLIVHHGIFDISKVILQPKESIFASVIDIAFETTEIEATNNHPIFTTKGQRKLGNIEEGDVVICFESATNSFKEFVVVKTMRNYRKVDAVYNIRTEHNSNYLINKTVVLPK
ncbi:MAG: hypothetical protein EAZ07_06230 [Cytophagales bacterium]|nr:MAG: hypothetical protein EAZ07_06230 [Cytophagales bacterium]